MRIDINLSLQLFHGSPYSSVIFGKIVRTRVINELSLPYGSPKAVVPNVFYFVASEQCVIISMDPSVPVNFLNLFAINYVYAKEHTYKIQYNLNSVFKLFLGHQKVFRGPQVWNH